MLDENKKLFQECADLIPKWKAMSKSDLARGYIEHENDDLANSYFSALMCKYWNLINSYYYKQQVKIANEGDCYDWLTEGILKGLEHRAWEDPKNQLYNDPIGPEKALTICITSTRLTFFQYTQHAKRKLNYNALSVDELEENSSDGYFIPYWDATYILDDYIEFLIQRWFQAKEYFKVFFLDALFNYDLDNGIDLKINKFMSYIRDVDDIYLISFASQYHLPFDNVKKAFFYLTIMPSYRIHANFNNILNELKNDETLFSLLQEKVNGN